MAAWRRELRELVRLGAPVVGVQIGFFCFNLVDTLMVGRLPAEAGRDGALACVGVGSFYHWVCIVFGFGTLMGLDPVVAQAVGAKDGPAVARGVQRGIVLCGLLSPLAMLVALPASEVLGWLDQPEEVVPRASAYAQINALGIIPFFVFAALRQSLQAMDRVRYVFGVIWAANALNVLLNWMLIYGNGGCPRLGVEGAAWATVASRWAMAVGLLAAEWKSLRPHLRPWHREAFAAAPLGRMLRIGAPIGLQYLLEFGIFGYALVIVGWGGTLPQEGHQVAINLASLSFTVPLGISAAAAVRVGQAVGRQDPAGARCAALLALGGGALVMAGFGATFLAIPAALAGCYSDRADVIAMAATLIPIAGVFQVFDGLQVVAIGALRGFGDTRAPAVINIAGFWLLGLPVSLWLGREQGLGATGVWWGLVAGLGSVSIGLLLRVRHHLGRDVVRVSIDR